MFAALSPSENKNSMTALCFRLVSRGAAIFKEDYDYEKRRKLHKFFYMHSDL